MPHTGIPFVPNLHHKGIEPVPFSFDNRDREMMARKEAKIHEIIKEEEQVGKKVWLVYYVVSMYPFKDGATFAKL